MQKNGKSRIPEAIYGSPAGELPPQSCGSRSGRAVHPGEEMAPADDPWPEPGDAEPDAISLAEDEESWENAAAPGNLPTPACQEWGLLEDGPGNIDPQLEDYSPDGAQLSDRRGVLQGMGTVALDRMRVEHRQAVAGPQSPAGIDFSAMTDVEIMQRAGAGDESCFEYLVDKYRRPIISFMYRMVHNQAVAEELAQEVFLRVYRARESYRAEARFSTWLYRIASNMAINHARDTKYERASSSLSLDEPDAETGARRDLPDMRPVVEENILHDERMRSIREHVMALPERQRMAVVMHKYQDMDYREIGAVLKLSESATKSLLFRAYQTLRERLKDFA
jgi:RNA polymerase sigma-70 factor (ECF subfamily)